MSVQFYLMQDYLSKALSAFSGMCLDGLRELLFYYYYLRYFASYELTAVLRQNVLNQHFNSIQFITLN